MKPALSRPALFLCAALAPLVAQSQSSATLEPIIVTAARMAQDEATTLGDVTLIDRDTLAQAGQSSVAQILGWAPGVEYYESGGLQGVAGVSLRGAGFSQTLLLIDGVRVNQATNGGAAINALTADQIERIEILRGGASSLYGADAIGGVINIITRKDSDQPLAARASLGLGSRGAKQSGASINGASQGWRYSAGASYRQSSNVDATLPSHPFGIHNPDRDSYYQRNLRGAVAYAWQPGQEIEVTTLHSRLNGGYDNGQPFYNDRTINTLDVSTIASRNQLTRDWHSTLQFASTRDRNRSYIDPDAHAPGKTVFTTRQQQYSWQSDFALTSEQRISVLLERLEQRVHGDVEDWSQGYAQMADYPVNRRNTNSASLVYLVDIGRHHVQANLRHDREDQFGNRTTGNLAYAYDLTPRWRAGVSAGNAFRAPTFNDLYYPGSDNPDLQPEKSRQAELNLSYQLDHGSIGLTAYRSRVRNLIAYSSASYRPENIDRAILEGLTLQAEQQFGQTRVNASLDLQNPHDPETGKQLPRRAKRLFKIAASHEWGPWEAGAQWRLSSHRYDDAANTKRLGSYALLDLTAGYQLAHGMALQLRWNNVFDKSYTLVEGYRTEGSSVLASLNWQY